MQAFARMTHALGTKQVNANFARYLFFFYLGSCPQAWIYHEGFCYKFSSQSLAWKEAKTACENMGSMLAVVDSNETQIEIARLAKLNNQIYYWIGLYRDPENTSRWLWVDWTRLCNVCGYWSAGEPNNHNGRFEGCGELWPSRSGLWNDESCSRLRHYICQKKGWYYSLVDKIATRFYLKYG